MSSTQRFLQRLDGPNVRDSVLILVLALVTLLVYWPALGSSFQFDDDLFLRDDNIQLGRTAAFLVPPSPRFLVWMTFLVQYQLWGPEAPSFHFLNVLLHLLNAVFVYLLIATLLEDRIAPGKSMARNRWISFLGAMIFALHPAQSEAVVYVYQRSTLMAALFSLLAILAYLKGAGLVSLLMFLLACFSKETAIVVPLLLWSIDYLKRSNGLRRYRLLMLAFAGLFLGTYLFHWNRMETPTVGETVFSRPGYLAVQTVVFWKYMKLAFFQLAPNVDRDLSSILETGRSHVWLSALGILALVGLACALGRKRPAWAFFLVFYLLFLVPTSSLISSQDLMFDHRIYLPIVGLCGLFSSTVLGLSQFVERKVGSRAAIFAVTALSPVLAFSAQKTVDRLPDWRTPQTLWEDTIGKSPNKYRPNLNYGLVLLDTNRQKALEYLAKAVELDPNEPLGHRALGECFIRLGDLSAALLSFEEAVALSPEDGESWLGLGRAYSKNRMYLQACDALHTARMLLGNDWRPYYYEAVLHLEFGFISRAVEVCETGLEIDHRWTQVRAALIEAMVRSENILRAKELAEENLALDRTSETFYTAARVLWAAGSRQEALARIDQGLTRADTPESARIGRNLKRLVLQLKH